MSQFDEMAEEFLSQRSIAVAGVSRSKDGTANGIYRVFREKGYEVFAINPNTDRAEGDPCYPDIKSLPHPVDGIMLVTRPDISEGIVSQCVEEGVPRVWMHNNTLMPSSVSDKATQMCRQNGIKVISGGCPMMFFDTGHKCFKWILGALGRLPEN